MYQGNKRKNGNNEERRPERRRSPLPPRKIDGEPAEGVVFGRNEVRELLRSGRSVDKLFIRKGELQGSVNLIVGEASERGIPIIEVEKEKLDSLCGGGVQQVLRHAG